MLWQMMERVAQMDKAKLLEAKRTWLQNCRYHMVDGLVVTKMVPVLCEARAGSKTCWHRSLDMRYKAN